MCFLSSELTKRSSLFNLTAINFVRSGADSLWHIVISDTRRANLSLSKQAKDEDAAAIR